MDPHRGHRILDRRGTASAQTARRHRRDHDLLGQSLRSLLFPRSGIWAVLATRLASHRTLVNGCWHLCLALLDCCWVAAGASRGLSRPAALHAHLLPALASRDATGSRRAVLMLTLGHYLLMTAPNGKPQLCPGLTPWSRYPMLQLGHSS